MGAESGRLADEGERVAGRERVTRCWRAILELYRNAMATGEFMRSSSEVV
jgi:hypothetical protein